MHNWFRALLPAVLCAVVLVLPLAARAAVMDTEEQAFVTLINNYRQQNGLQPLKISDKLDAAASWMSTDMGQKRYFNHTDSQGRSFSQRLKAFGYTYATYSGENIAAGNATASATFTQWKNSSGHNANMLNPNFKVMGIARAYTAGSPYGWYWTNDFGGYDDSGSVTPPPPTPTKDTIVPTVTLTTPANGATVSGTITLTATASDNVGVQRVVFAVSGGPTMTDTSAPYAATLYTNTLSNGSHTITATVYDAAGNQSRQNITVTVSNGTTPTAQKPGTPTSLRLAAQTTGALLSWTPGTGGAAERYEVQVYRYALSLSQVKTLTVTAPATSVRVTVPTTGTYYLRVRASNATGASAYSSWISGKITAGQ